MRLEDGNTSWAIPRFAANAHGADPDAIAPTLAQRVGNAQNAIDLAKEFTFLARAKAAGIVLGASVPIVLTSRADSHGTKVASCGLAALMVRATPFWPTRI